jgi:hypothetical protein
MLRQNGWKSLIAASLVILAACGSAETTAPPESTPLEPSPADVEPTPSGDSMEAPTPDASPTIEHPIPNPDPGMASVYGYIKWNREGVPDLGLLMCAHIELMVGCEGGGPEFSSRTELDGMYTILNIPPGTYNMVVESVDGDEWFFVPAGQDPDDIAIVVAADQILRIPDYYMAMYEMVLIYPGEGERIDDPRPTFEWDPHIDATFYNIYITQSSGGLIASGEDLKTTQFTPETDLPNCEYGWQVEAYNDQGIKIAEHKGYSPFTIYGQPSSC